MAVVSRMRVQAPVDRKQNAAHREREHEQQQRHRHGQIDIVQADRSTFLQIAPQTSLCGSRDQGYK